MNLRQVFDLSLVNRRDEVALEWLGAEYTFGEIDARSNRVANAFRAWGLKQGDRVCVYLANCSELIDIYLACVKTGVIFVPINILYREREMAHILSDAEPARYIAEADLPALQLEAARQSDTLEAVGLHFGDDGSEQGRDSDAQ
jgi:malonyl-CoA/methylmalonyl-CoA synthetase